MLTSPFFRRLFLPYLLLICAAIGIVGIVGAQRLRGVYLDDVRQSLGTETRLLESMLSADLGADRAAELNTHVRRIGQTIGRRITIVTQEGVVLADNEANPAAMENHRLRPEILTAASRGEGESVRPSDTIHQDLLYFARRVIGVDGQPYYLRVSQHLSELSQHLRMLYGGIALAAGAAMIMAAVICYVFARRHARPLVELTEFARGLQSGDLSRRVLHRDRGEMGELASALDSMAESLGSLIEKTQQDKSQLMAVLSSMNEGVIATDVQQRIVIFNEAAVRLLDFSAGRCDGALLWEVVRYQPILQAAGEVLQTHHRRDFKAGPIAGRHLDVTICTFPGGAQPEGLVIVVHDATQSVRYQELRKEFVANVSHELRTPLTAIKGFAETLREGAMQDPEHAQQYLATIEKHADQLTNLVNDLLELSRLESLPGLSRIVPTDPNQIAEKAVELLGPVARRKRQTLTLRTAPGLRPVPGNPEYLERAVANLLDNAIKYTPEGGTVLLSVSGDDHHATIEVTDNGIGIPPADLPRVFERFYRVDRSRSRDMGGTGLGLSIVKHIAQAHRGNIDVSSTPGEGSTFRLTLPLARRV